MKKQFLLIAFIGLMLAGSSAVAQTKIGGFVGYGTEVEELGVGINGEFGLASKVAISPSLMFWFVDNANVWEVNVNVNYYFVKGAADFYGIGGLNLLNAKAEGASDGNSELGLNLGAGFNFNVSKKVQPFTEAKFVIGDFDQLALLFGLKFRL